MCTFSPQNFEIFACTSEEINEDLEDKTKSSLSPPEDARKRINLALIDIKDHIKHTPFQQFPCTKLGGCYLNLISGPSTRTMLTWVGILYAAFKVREDGQ